MNRKSVPFKRVCFCERNVIPVLRAACCNVQAHARGAATLSAFMTRCRFPGDPTNTETQAAPDPVINRLAGGDRPMRQEVPRGSWPRTHTRGGTEASPRTPLGHPPPPGRTPGIFPLPSSLLSLSPASSSPDPSAGEDGGRRRSCRGRRPRWSRQDAGEEGQGASLARLGPLVTAQPPSFANSGSRVTYGRPHVHASSANSPSLDRGRERERESQMKDTSADQEAKRDVGVRAWLPLSAAYHREERRRGRWRPRPGCRSSRRRRSINHNIRECRRAGKNCPAMTDC